MEKVDVTLLWFVVLASVAGLFLVNGSYAFAVALGLSLSARVVYFYFGRQKGTEVEEILKKVKQLEDKLTAMSLSKGFRQ